MEKHSDSKPAVTDIEVSNPPPNPVTDDTTAVETEPLYFTKDGRAKFGITAPTAFALNYPYPPLPSNLAKNRVLRAADEQTKESVQAGITEAEKKFEKEAMPLPSLNLQGMPLPKLLIPEIELAIYWDRHPYEFRVPEKGQLAEHNNGANSKNNNSAMAIRRSKSDMNLASKVGKLLEEHSVSGNSNSKRSSISGSNKTIRSTSVTAAPSPKNSVALDRNELLSPKNSRFGEHFPVTNTGNNDYNHISNGNRCASDVLCGSGSGNSSRKSSANEGHDRENGKRPGIDSGKLHAKNNAIVNANQSLQMSENERKKFEDIKLFHHQNERQCSRQNNHSRPKLIRSHEQLEGSSTKKSAGIQVTIDDVAAAALKSTYLCPLHGQYKRGIERRDKGGFRTDMGATNNVHAHCSRALKGKPSRTKMIKTAETQTDGEVGTIPFHSKDNRTNKRSRTAGLARNPRKGKEIMASEYHGSFRDPYKIAESEKRHLRNKILNYCFTKHSIF